MGRGKKTRAPPGKNPEYAPLWKKKNGMAYIIGLIQWDQMEAFRERTPFLKKKKSERILNIKIEARQNSISSSFFLVKFHLNFPTIRS